MALNYSGGDTMTTTLRRMAAIAACLLGTMSLAAAAEVTVYATVGVKHSLEDLAAQFEKTSGHKLKITFGTAAALAKRVQGGEQADLYVLTRQALETLSKDGKVADGTQRNFASSLMGVAVKKGAPKPDVSTVEAFKQTLLAAKSIAYPDPAGGGFSGVYFVQIVEKLGIAEQVKAKAKHPTDALAARLVMNGEAEIAVNQKPELAAFDVEIIGAFPAGIDVTTVYSAGVSKDSKESAAAAAIIKFLEGPEAAAVFKRDGFEVGPPAKAS